jgi:hypothetical protein
MRYDKVELNHPDGTGKTLKPAEFEDRPRLDRVQWLAPGRILFLKGGVKVPSDQAPKPEK